MGPRRGGSERCLWNALKRRGFPVSIFRQGDTSTIGERKATPEGKNCVSEDQKWATGCILSDNGNPKWKSR